MPFVEYKQGFPFTSVTFPYNVCDALIVQNLKLEQLLSYINNNCLTKIKIEDIDDLSFLQRCPSIRHICLEIKSSFSTIKSLSKKGKYYIKTLDISELYSLEDLKSIDVQDNVEPIVKLQLEIDLSRLKYIEDISAEFTFLKNISEATTLKSINLIGFMSKNKDFSELSTLTNLDTIRIVKGNIESLQGIQNLKNIQCLYLYNLRYLKDISGLQHITKTLKALRIENCANIEDFSVLEKLENLELLDLSGSNSIPNIRFIEKMKRLKTFVFSVNVVDGDLSLCKNLKYVYSEKNRKHYNIKDDELPKGIYVRGNEDIEEWRRTE